VRSVDIAQEIGEVKTVYDRPRVLIKVPSFAFLRHFQHFLLRYLEELEKY
jgi:hypothetical protein